MNDNVITLRDAMVDRCVELNIHVDVKNDSPISLKCMHYQVLFTRLPEKCDRSFMHEFLDAELHQVLEQWKKVSQANANDIYLVFVGPEGSADDPHWDSFAAEIERDERLCRKLVWLPSKKNGADLFIRRTFLAHPWEEGSIKDADALEVLGQELGIEKSWLSLLKNPELSGRELLIELIKNMDEDNV